MSRRGFSARTRPFSGNARATPLMTQRIETSPGSSTGELWSGTIFDFFLCVFGSSRLLPRKLSGLHVKFQLHGYALATSNQKRTADKRRWTQILRGKNAGFLVLLVVTVRWLQPDRKELLGCMSLSAFICVHLWF